MAFKIGEKVKFLNEKGGGKVVAIIDNKMVRIETDEGFEMPVLTKELIKDFRSEQSEELLQAVSPSPIVEKESTEDEETRVSQINPWGRVREEKGVYLAYEPHDQQWLLTGDVDLLLVNNTDMEMLYNLFLVQNQTLQGIDYGSVPPKSKILVDTIQRDQLEHWCSGYLQVMFHQDKPGNVYLPVNNVIDIKPSRFFKEGSYVENTLLDGRVILVSIAPFTTLTVATDKEIVLKEGNQVQQEKAGVQSKKALIDKYRTAVFEAVVDLHIAELVDNIAGLSSHDMFNIQMDTFRKTLDSAIENEYNKVTYIHGVGNGVLKNAIVKELEHYETTSNRMASISKFGVGAIDVLLKNRE